MTTKARPLASYRGARRNAMRLDLYNLLGFGFKGIRGWRQGPHFSVKHNTIRRVWRLIDGIRKQFTEAFVAIQVVHQSYINARKAT